MKKLIDDILEYSKLSSKTSLESEVIVLNDVVIKDLPLALEVFGVAFIYIVIIMTRINKSKDE